MLLSRACRFVLRKLVAVWLGIFLRALALPWLRIRRVLRRPSTIRPSFRSAAVTDGDRYYKIALGRKNTIGIEYRNFLAAAGKWPELLAVLPDLRLGGDWLVSYLSMSRYHPVALEGSVAHASNLYRLMRTCSDARARRMALSDSEELQAGIEIIADLYGDLTSDRVRQHVEGFLESGDYNLGFAHGDFHSRNIMLDDCGAPRLVDLDCIRLNGVQELDALYFVLEWEWSRSGAPWHYTIVDMLSGTASEAYRVLLGTGFGVEESFGLATTYLVDRIGQESRNFGVRWYSRAALDPAIARICAAHPTLAAT